MAKRQSREGSCSVEGCDKPILAVGLCNTHYATARRHNGDPLGKHNAGICSVEGCDQPAATKGMCNRHYRAARRVEHDTSRLCAMEGCTRFANSRGWCSEHYKIAARVSDLNYANSSRCAVVGCTGEAQLKGLCEAHYMRLLRYGDPLYQRPKKVRETKPGMLSEEQVRLIQSQAGLLSSAELAAQYGTTIRTIIAIQAGRNWGRLEK
ncbi:MAG: hypothetical protein ACTHLT_05820 [Devosia sp.]